MLVALFQRVAGNVGGFSTATTTTEVYPFFGFFLGRSFFSDFGRRHNGEEDYFDASIRFETERTDREEWDGLLRGLALVLVVGGIVSIVFGILPTWKFLLGFFGAVGTLTILLAVAVAAVWVLWGKK